jgi:hypothetical protein
MRPLNPAMGPVERFACELRALRAAAGEVPFGTMARHSTVSKSALAAAVAGYQLPSERVLSEFVRLCRGDREWWLERLARARAESEATAPQPAAQETGEGGDEKDGRGWLVPRPAAHVVLPPAQALPDPLPVPASPGRRRRPRRGLLIGALAALLAFTAGWFVHPAAGRSAARTPTPAPVAPADGVDPYIAGCGHDQKIIERQGMVWPDESAYGWLVLYYSPRCQSNWGYVTGPNSTKWRVHIIVRRPADDASAQSSASADVRPGSWSSVLMTAAGCVYVEAYVVTSAGQGRSAKTSCYKATDPVHHGTPSRSPSRSPSPSRS